MQLQSYPYIKEDILEKKINYSYSEFWGQEFLIEWRRTREEYLKKSLENFDIIKEFNLAHLQSDDFKNTDQLFNKWILEINNSVMNYEKLNLLLKRFEVAKRLYGEYDDNYRPINKLDFKKNLLYIKFGCVLVLAFKKTCKIQYLNSLLKINDILCSIYNLLDDREKLVSDWLIKEEIIFVEKLVARLVSPNLFSKA